MDNAAAERTKQMLENRLTLIRKAERKKNTEKVVIERKVFLFPDEEEEEEENPLQERESE